MISRTQAEALATFITRIRPDWDHPGILAAIGKAQHLGSPAAIGSALCRLADNRELRTPATLPDPGAHWAGTPVAAIRPPTMCGDHPRRRALNCPDCAAELGAVDHATHANQLRTAIRRGNAERRRLKRGAP
jgi:hypothetical protein